ncbi:uncharacterized protein [Physcomitrium patens]|nr:uncharacterized protein LOC112281893 isoform X1 [Physcomitrium patens]XP_024374656.1 uncharacterized protein LOC112281893 isoform X1 [Physcomitrium patens]|eukprot:XP_024374655.1 uncharacterized protein LOC112281893 isoform X1 [Physcomitrella patens]
MEEVGENALAFSSEAKMQQEASAEAEFLNKMMELVSQQSPPSFLLEFVPRLLEFQVDPGNPVHEIVVKKIEEAGLHHIDYVQVVAPALLSLLQDTSSAVVQRSITSGSTIFRIIFEQVTLQSADGRVVDQSTLECWNWMVRFKDAVYSLAFQYGNDDVRLLALAFVESTFLLFTPDSKNLPPDQQISGMSQESHATWLAGGHPTLDANTLRQEASNNLGLLLNQLQISEAPTLSCLVAFSIINSLIGIAERRPSISSTIFPVLLSLVPNSEPFTGSHNEKVLHELKEASLNILNSDQPSALPWRDQLVAALRPMNGGETGDRIVQESESPASVPNSSKFKGTGSSTSSRITAKPRSTSTAVSTVTAPTRPASPLRKIRTSSASTNMTIPSRPASPARQIKTSSVSASVTPPPRIASSAIQIRTSSAATTDKGPPRTASPSRHSKASSASATITASPRTASPLKQPKTSSSCTTVTAAPRPASPLRQIAKAPGSLSQNGLSGGKGFRGTSPARPRPASVNNVSIKVSSSHSGTSADYLKSSSVVVPFPPTSARSSVRPALTSLKISPRPSPSSSPRGVPSVENPKLSGVVVPFPLTSVKSLPKPSITSVKLTPCPTSPSVKPTPRTARLTSSSVKLTPRPASPSARASVGASPRTTSVTVTTRPASPSPAARKLVVLSKNTPTPPSPRASEKKLTQVPTLIGQHTGVPVSSRSNNGKPSAVTNLAAVSPSQAPFGRNKFSSNVTAPSLLKAKASTLTNTTRKGSLTPSCESSQNMSYSSSDLNLHASSEQSDATATLSIVQEVPTQRLRIASFKRNSSGLSKATEIISPEVLPVNPITMNTKKRCGWITSQSDDVHIAYHDSEWAIPIYDDKLLFELIVLQGAQAELSWPTILARRNNFRAAFANFDPAIVAKFDEKKKLSLIADSSICFPEAKVRGAVDNAAHVLKIIEEYGSLSKFLWSYVNHKPVVSQYKLAKQVPVKTPKSEALSKELIRRGFRFVGPTTMYSVMQAAGLVCDHLVTCYKYLESSAGNSPVMDPVIEGEKIADPWQRISLPTNGYPLEFKRASANASDPVWAELPIIEEAREDESDKNSEDGDNYDDLSTSSKLEISVC